MKRDNVIYATPTADMIEVVVESGFINSTPIYDWGDGGTEEEEVYLFYKN